MDVDEEEEDSSTETGEVGDMGEGEKRQRSTVHKVSKCSINNTSKH